MIKNPKVMRYGYRYELKNKTDEYGNLTKYCYAQPVEYADGCKTGDCWLVDKHGNVHPGYNVSPVPLHVSGLKNGVEVFQGCEGQDRDNYTDDQDRENYTL